jgi:hypothetical protein
MVAVASVAVPCPALALSKALHKALLPGTLQHLLCVCAVLVWPFFGAEGHHLRMVSLHLFQQWANLVRVIIRHGVPWSFAVQGQKHNVTAALLVVL